MNAGSLRRYAAQMYPLAQAQPGNVITSRPLPGNEITLLRSPDAYRLALCRWEVEISGEDLAAVAQAFAVPENVEPTLNQRTERHPAANKSMPRYYARWAWRE
jgi:hypothetical protein